MFNRKRKPSSISTAAAMKVVNPNSLQTAQSKEIPDSSKSDFDLLEIGVRADGGPQLAVDKKKVKAKKSNSLDIGKYMPSVGSSSPVDSSAKSDMLKKLLKGG